MDSKSIECTSSIYCILNPHKCSLPASDSVSNNPNLVSPVNSEYILRLCEIQYEIINFFLATAAQMESERTKKKITNEIEKKREKKKIKYQNINYAFTCAFEHRTFKTFITCTRTKIHTNPPSNNKITALGLRIEFSNSSIVNKAHRSKHKKYSHNKRTFYIWQQNQANRIAL